ncbi:arginyl-tRNA synthetase [Anaerobranca californiensis DSM 14826]|jgi:arginyl-tRNA synthetase|uniref:Arginine--tRNA ligase n=1 Tax=Anaerobranca californiensis DSM 14826 TaxID=1120989 RepID=A0A1M6KKT8_9FIRM|nr:arginine--tRNA ligase [Anaerobranca californiensis]SHJ59441.1 arginyl-tRNA synthetase [Anaerobranca californiensis DSM 14826]
MDKYKKIISEILEGLTGLSRQEILDLIEQPDNPEYGDLAFPTFSLAKTLRKAPAIIAQELVEKIQKPSDFSKVVNLGPYVNFFIDTTKLMEETIKEIIEQGDEFGSSNLGEGKTVVIDFSSPNIAKPFGIGHLRSTVIGNSLYKIHKFLGFNVVGINHIGDWGTQFGKVIVAFDKWGDLETLNNSEDPVKYLYDLYVKFHEEAEKDPALEDLARDTFKDLENGDEEKMAKWQMFRDISLKELKRIYDILGVHFDSYKGEQFYNDLIPETLETLINKGITEISEGALIVNLDKFDLPPILLRKKDGATLYATRDICAAIYRYNKYKFDKMLYVVGAEQSLHFKQVFKTLAIAGFDFSENCEHIPFGLFRFQEGKMSTRKGNLIFLDDVIKKAISLTKEIILEKNPNLQNKDEVSKQVGVGAIIFGDLYNDRIKNVIFDWDKILDFNGETGPYVQYSHARICSLLRKSVAEEVKPDFAALNSEYEDSLVKKLSQFPDVVKNSIQGYKPSVIARYLISVAKEFNRYYHYCPINKEENPNIRQGRLMLAKATAQVIKNGLNLLGIEAPEEM